jgi:hypothetical protein
MFAVQNHKTAKLANPEQGRRAKAGKGREGSVQLNSLWNQLAMRVQSAGGHDPRPVTLHADRAAADVAAAADALAVTVGSDIYFGSGQFMPGTKAGDALIAHEATHARQYREGRIPMNGGVSAPSDPLEQEAFAAAARMTGLPVSVMSTSHARPGVAAGSGPMLMRWDRDNKGRFTQLGRMQLGAELMARGVNFDQLGDLDALADLGDDAAIRALLDTLDVMNKGSDRLGDPKRIVNSWNVNKDDIGFTNPRGTKYKTILHYVAELNRLAQASMGMNYVEAAKAMPDVRLSGVRIHSGGVGVHPRAVYFVAAGQVGIDDAAAKAVAEATAQAGADPNRKKAADTMRRAFGEGHYIPAGGFQWLFKDVVTMLTTLGYSTAPNPRATGAAAKGVQRAKALDRGDLIYKVMRLEIERMLLVLEGQEANVDVPSHEAAAHREPQFRAFLLARKKDIEAVADPKDNDDVARAAREMLVALGRPGRTVSYTHGGGTIDPHGTDHAMGLAFDFYNGSGAQGAFRNFQVEQWPFIHRLISEFGDEVGLPTNLRPSSIDAVSPDKGQAIAQLLRDHGAEVAKEMLDEADAADAAEKADPKVKVARATTLRTFKRLRFDTLSRMAGRRAAINRITEEQMLHFPATVRAELANVARDLRGFESVLNQFTPTDIIRMLDDITVRLAKLRAEAQSAAAMVETEAKAAEDAAEKERATREQTAITKEEADVASIRNQRDEELKGLDDQIKKVEDDLKDDKLDSKAKTNLRRQKLTLENQRSKAINKWKEAERREQADVVKTTSQFTRERTIAATTTKRAAAARAAAALALAKVAPDPEPLEDLEGALANIEADADEAAAIEIDRALRPILKSGSFKQWLKVVSDADHPIFDQPKAVIQGLDSVAAHAPIGGKQTTHFYSGHHWAIAPREILDSDATYRASLDRDMGNRDLDNLRRVLSVMAESPGGRAILFGPAATRDKTFDDALEARLKALKTTSKDLLDQVKAQVITPYESLSGESGKLLKDLRDRGYLLVAP